jgi:FAD/FMN-containing dehydrogenase
VTTQETRSLGRALDRSLRGQAIHPGHPRYEEARRIDNHRFDKHPAVIARCADAVDVATALGFASREGLEVAVRGGGHGAAGVSSVEDGLVIDLSPMRSVQVDAGTRTASVGGGATAGDLDRATHTVGLATPSATVSTVGVAGFTLGGGIGYLNRAHGLALDNLIAADVVLADGGLVHASEESESDLFWGLRGGGGNFGVVTELRFRLHPVDTVVGGPILWPLEDVERLLALYLQWLPEQPDDIYAFFAVLTVPPLDPFPEELRLRPACGLVWCNTAPLERSHAALESFRAAAPPPLLDAVAELPYPALQRAFDPDPALRTYDHMCGRCFASLPAEAGSAFARFGRTAPGWLSFTHLYPLDGAAARGAGDAAAWPWRDAAFAQMILGSTEAASDEERHCAWAWAREFSAALGPYALEGAYQNFVMDEGPEVARASYGASYDRLARIKARFDPDNVFRANQNVEPAR